MHSLGQEKNGHGPTSPIDAYVMPRCKQRQKLFAKDPLDDVWRGG